MCKNNDTSERICIRLTSSEHGSLCQHPAAGPAQWSGDQIALKHNGQTVAYTPRGFTRFEHCIDEVYVATDRLQLHYTGSDGVCITGLFVNGSRVLVRSRQSFWIDSDDLFCPEDDNFLSTTDITFSPDGSIISFGCKNG